MASSVSADFFENGSNKQFEWVLSKYQEALQAKAEAKPGKAESLLKLDKWYQNDLPKKIKSRGKEAHLTHDEIVQTIKWKLARGVFRPRLKDLIQMNTPRVVIQESKKAFRAIDKRSDLESAVGALSNLKGVGPAMASAVLAAGAPEIAPFMADECLLSMEGTEGIDYTMKEYMKLVAKTNQCVKRLKDQGGDWTPHKVEMAVWTHYVARDLKPEILEDMPLRHEVPVDRFNGEDSSSPVPVNGDIKDDEETNDSETNGVEVEEEEEPVTNGEAAVTNGGVAENTVAGDTSEAVSNGVTVNSDEPTESSPEVTGEVSTNGSQGEPQQETPAIKNGDHESSKGSEADPSVPTKRPLEDVSDIETAAPEMKRVREDESATEEERETVSPVCPQIANTDVGVVPPGGPTTQPIHTGAD